MSGVSILTLANSLVLNESGEQVKFANLWKNQTTLFIFLRHFGCVSCRSHAVQIWQDREKYEKNGTKIIFIGNGTFQYIHYFKEDLNIPDATIYTDPTLNSFYAVGFKRGFLAALGPRSIANGIKMFTKGHRQGAYSKDSGDLWQLGGVIVIKSNGVVAYQYISQALGDFPPENDVTKNINN